MFIMFINKGSLLHLFIAIFLVHAVAEAPTKLQAVYRSATSISLEWIYTLNIENTSEYRYVVYYEYAGDNVRHDVSDSSGVNTYLLTGLPIGGVDNISLVAVRHLPSDVVGPVDPGILAWLKHQ